MLYLIIYILNILFFQSFYVDGVQKPVKYMDFFYRQLLLRVEFNLWQVFRAKSKPPNWKFLVAVPLELISRDFMCEIMNCVLIAHNLAACENAASAFFLLVSGWDGRCRIMFYFLNKIM